MRTQGFSKSALNEQQVYKWLSTDLRQDVLAHCDNDQDEGGDAYDDDQQVSVA